MTALAKSLVRGSCPGALRPMESGDGLLVRVRPRAATLSLDAARAIAEAARACGNGHIDLTRRANLQIRGVTPATLAELHGRLDAAGLLDATPEAEAVRNIVTSPLAGIDPGAVLDVAPLARELEGLLAAEPAAARLPAKFGFLIDGGGALLLDGERADIHLRAMSPEAVAVGIDHADGVRWLGAVEARDAAATAVRVALAFVRVKPAGRARMRDVSEAIVSPSPLWGGVRGGGKPDVGRSAIPPSLALPREGGGNDVGAACHLATPHHDSRSAADDDGRASRVGAIRHDGRVMAVGVAAPFGRVEADALAALADAAGTAGADELRVSPWRVVYVAVSDETAAARLLHAARGLGFIVDSGDPMLAIHACPGAPACRSAAADVRNAARTLAPLLAAMPDVRSVHISGCAKGCACSAPCGLVLVGAGAGFSVLRHARADGVPEAFLAGPDLARLPALLASRPGGPRHA